MTIMERRVDTDERTPASQVRARPSAVVWINGRVATVVCKDADGQEATWTIERGVEPELAYLAGVVRAIGDRERVMILGPGSERLALEREYVAIRRRPERLVDVEPSGPLAEADLIERLRLLAA